LRAVASVSTDQPLHSLPEGDGWLLHDVAHRSAQVPARQIFEPESAVGGDLHHELVEPEGMDLHPMGFGKIDREGKNEGRVIAVAVLPDRVGEIVTTKEATRFDLGQHTDEVDRDAAQGMIAIDIDHVLGAVGYLVRCLDGAIAMDDALAACKLGPLHRLVKNLLEDMLRLVCRLVPVLQGPPRIDHPIFGDVRAGAEHVFGILAAPHPHFRQGARPNRPARYVATSRTCPWQAGWASTILSSAFVITYPFVLMLADDPVQAGAIPFCAAGKSLPLIRAADAFGSFPVRRPGRAWSHRRAWLQAPGRYRPELRGFAVSKGRRLPCRSGAFENEAHGSAFLAEGFVNGFTLCDDHDRFCHGAPMSFQKATDLLRLVEMATSRYQGVSLLDIEEEFGVDRRTAQRMTRALEDQFPTVITHQDDERRKFWKLKGNDARLMLSQGIRDSELAALELSIRRAELEGATP
jgi:hypothetical protein